MVVGKKKNNGPICTPESPRKVLKDTLEASPRKNEAASSKPTSRRRGESASPVRPKKQIDFDQKTSVVTGTSGEALATAFDEMPPSPPTIGEIMKKKKSEMTKVESKKKTDKKKKPKKTKKALEVPKSPYRGPFEEMELRKSPLREIPPKENITKIEAKEEVKEELVEENPVKEMPKLTKRPEVKEEDSNRRNLNDVLKSPEPKDDKKKIKKTKPKRKVKKDADQDFEKKAPIKRITDFFEIRRSNRKTGKQIEDEKDDLWRDLVRSDCQEGLEIRNCPIKQRGIYSTREFKKGDFVVEYRGTFFYPENIEESYAQESKYYEDPETGSYMYWFDYKGKKYCIDATAESPFYGRLLNHSCKVPNCATKPLDMQDPIDPVRLIIYAKEDIPSGTELLYDYGDRSKQSLEIHPWLKL